MKKLKNKIAFVLLFILVSAMSQAKGLDPRFQILPLPQNIEILKGQGIAGSELAYIVSKGESKIPVLGTLLDALPRIEKQGTGITLSLSEGQNSQSLYGFSRSSQWRFRIKPACPNPCTKGLISILRSLA